MRVIGRILLYGLATLGLLMVVFVGAGLWFISTHGKGHPAAERVVLTLDLNRGLSETPSSSPFGALDGGREPYALADLTEALRRAAQDPKVSGLLARLDEASFGMAQAQELRDAVAAFRASGKPATVFSESFGGVGAGTVEYYVATAFGEIWLQPSGDVGITGLHVENPFMAGTLAMLGVTPQFGARYEYKSAIDTFTETGFTEENRATMRALLDSFFAQAVEGIAQGRGLTPEAVRGLVDRAPVMAQEALAAKLVDRLGYWDEVQAQALAGAIPLDLGDYHDPGARRGPAEGPKIALIYGTGAVTSGSGEGGPFGEPSSLAARSFTKALREAVADPEVRAIVLRIDSPGGSYTASDAIWREVQRARAQGKKVVASMSNTAASGGYFVAMAADRILAQPGTVTGSIGVFSGKMATQEFWKKLGVTWDTVHVGENAALWSSVYPFSDVGWQRLEAMLDRVYQDFTGKAAQARKMDAAAMDKVARGRIWSGTDALRVGLVDELGGLDAALRSAKELAGLAPDAAVAVQVFPEPKGPFEQIGEMLGGGDSELRAGLAALRALGQAAVMARPVLREMSAGGPDATLRAPLPAVR